MTEKSATEITRKRYNRVAWYYDAVETMVEYRVKSSRENLVQRVKGPDILEVGVGTGKNMRYYPEGSHVTAIDLSPGMLARARKRAAKMKLDVDLREGDVQDLDFRDQSFDTILATFVFCSAPDPVKGLEEVLRVCKSGGRLLLLEHVRPKNPITARLFDYLNHLSVRITGININRNTALNVRRAGWTIKEERMVYSDSIQLIEAKVGKTAKTKAKQRRKSK